jgi:hypothetical protein
VLWALGQPAAVAGLLGAFLLGVGLRALAQRLTARSLGVPVAGPVLPAPRRDVDPFGALVAVFGGTGWGREWAPGEPPGRTGPPAARPARRRELAVLVAGPLTVLVASQAALAGFRYAFPDHRAALRLNYPSDVLRGVVVRPSSAQLLLSVAVGLLCFALLTLVPLPPLDGFRLVWSRARRSPAHALSAAVLLVLLAVPVGPRAPVLLQVFDVVGTPLMRVWT